MKTTLRLLRKLIREEIDNVGYNKTMERKNLTVEELIKFLSRLDPSTLVYEENQGEFRSVESGAFGDIRLATNIDDADTGKAVQGTVVVFSAWS